MQPRNIFLVFGMAGIFLISATASLAFDIADRALTIPLQRPRKDPNQHTIYVSNKTKSPVRVAVRIQLPGDIWTTTRWTQIAPGNEAVLSQTKNSIFYYYAEALDGSGNWSGVKSGPGYHHKIEDSQKQYSFKELRMSPDPGVWLRFTIELTEP